MYDVAVIGAGPAGSMTAWKLAQKDRSVVIIDRRKKVGIPIQCGEGLSKYALDTNELEVQEKWVRQRIKGARIFVPNEKHILITGEGYAIDRAVFDQSIADLAQEEGAELRLKTSVTSIERKNDEQGMYYTLHTIHTDKTNTSDNTDNVGSGDIDARYVVGADGPHSIVAQWAGIPFKAENVLGYQYKFPYDYVEKNLSYEFESQNQLKGDWLDFHYANRWPNGYVWVFPRGNVYNIGICGPGKLKEKLDQYCIESGLNPEKRIEINAGQIPRGTIIPKFVKHNVLIVGDAAGLTNPLTKGGIHAAIFSGRQAGLALVDALESGSPELINKYEIVMKGSKFTDPKMMEHGKLIYSLSDDAASFVGDLLNGKDFTEFSCIKAIIPILKNLKILPFIPRFLKILKALKISSVYGW